MEGQRSAQGEAPPAADERCGGFLLLLLCIVSAVEGADQVLLPTTFHALELDLGLTLGNLASLNLAQALLQALAAPVWGVLADRGVLARRTIFVTGCTGWGLLTCLMAVVSRWEHMAVLRALNGAMLACLRPVSNGAVADVASEGCRGRAFGRIQFSLNMGMMATTLLATPLAARRPAAGLLAGWRLAFLAVGLLSLATAALVSWKMEEPPRKPAARREGVCSVVRMETGRLWGYFKLPTFCVVIAEGALGCVPWSVMGFATLYFQKAGLNSFQASVLLALGIVSAALGNLLGGLVGDALTRRSRHHGRPLAAQLSVLAGIPLVWLIFRGLPPNPESFACYAVLVTALGLSATWVSSGVNWPILSEIVGSEGRSAIMAWDTALEGTFAALFGPPMVGLLAEGYFGTQGQAGGALALGQAMVLTACTPWVACLLFFSVMHWSYPLDLRRVATQQQCGADAMRAPLLPPALLVV